ncbi:MAG: ATP-binding cassette domain-containing protein, partial [Gemmatimonadetes bacterium]|nr:ATP-binding cassette domain-containing protein [Gemmatimonadota bacterium]
MSAAIALHNICKRFGDKAAVEDLSLEVPPGCIYGFLGPNGAGKTTLLRMIVGIFYPDRGSLRVLGERDPAAVRERIGYLPEERGIYDRMRLDDLMTYYGRLKGMGARDAREVSRRLLSEYGLGDWREKKCNTLSKGMAQKVQILATTMHGPDLVILDEPFSGLDPVNRDVMR